MTSKPPTAAELQATLAAEFQAFVDEATIIDASLSENALLARKPIRQRVMLGRGFLTLTITNTQRGHHRTIRFTPRLPRGQRARSTWNQRETGTTGAAATNGRSPATR